MSTWQPLKPAKFWDYKHIVVDNLLRWPHKDEVLRAAIGIDNLNAAIEGGLEIHVPVGENWWLPLPAYFALGGKRDVPSTSVLPSESPFGIHIENIVLEQVEIYNWKLRLHDSRQARVTLQALMIVDALLENNLNLLLTKSKPRRIFWP